MPIRFHCKRCHQLLGIASRKAGSEIQCPKCGIAQIVPTEEAAAAALAMDQFAKTRPAVENPADLVVYDDEPSAIETPRPRPPETAAAGKTTPSPPIGEFPVELARPLPQGVILYPRRTFYVQGLLLVILAAVAFGAGYFIGLGDASDRKLREEEEAERQRVPIRGKLVYDPGTGKIAGDENAVVIALPEGKSPASEISVQGIRPRDPPPSENDPSVRKIRELGGAYTRADALGAFYMVVPDQGEYRMLIISNNAARPTGVEIDEVDLSEMQQYFQLAEHLVGRSQYRWTLEEVNVGFNPIELEFGRDGQE
jgi:phage FluMu protein Com